MNGWVINKAAVSRLALDYARETRYYYRDADGVSENFLRRFNGTVRGLLKREIDTLPSAGGGRRIK